MSSDVAFPQRLVRIFGRILIGLLIVEVISDVIFIVVWRSRWQPAIDALRWFNKRIQNPVMLKVAGKRNRGSATIHHTGRRSRREYLAPVWAQRAGESFFIPLPYGTRVDWCRNVMASGGCVLDHNGVHYDTVAPAIVPVDEAAWQLPGLRLRMFRLMGVELLLRLEISRPATPVDHPPPSP